jgi:hypothetical protein
LSENRQRDRETERQKGRWREGGREGGRGRRVGGRTEGGRGGGEGGEAKCNKAKVCVRETATRSGGGEIRPTAPPGGPPLGGRRVAAQSPLVAVQWPTGRHSGPEAARRGGGGRRTASDPPGPGSTGERPAARAARRCLALAGIPAAVRAETAAGRGTGVPAERLLPDVSGQASERAVATVAVVVVVVAAAAAAAAPAGSSRGHRSPG